MNNNFDVQMNREVNAVSVTVSSFAVDNGLDLMRLKGTISRDNSIKPSFNKNNVNYYKLEVITDWFEKNKHRFNNECKSDVVAVDTEFYCGTNNHYVPLSDKGASGKRCKSCDVRAAKAKKARPMEYSGRGKVPQHIIDFTERRDKAALKRENAVINNVDAWMYD